MLHLVTIERSFQWYCLQSENSRSTYLLQSNTYCKNEQIVIQITTIEIMNVHSMHLSDISVSRDTDHRKQHRHIEVDVHPTTNSAFLDGRRGHFHSLTQSVKKSFFFLCILNTIFQCLQLHSFFAFQYRTTQPFISFFINCLSAYEQTYMITVAFEPWQQQQQLAPQPRPQKPLPFESQSS
jgi:hypothetical protein